MSVPETPSMRVVLGVTGGIAAYKSAELTRRLKDRGADVQVGMTAGARGVVPPPAPTVVPPAMKRLMWSTAATQANVAALRQRGLTILGPAEGAQACGETG